MKESEKMKELIIPDVGANMAKIWERKGDYLIK